MNRKIKIIFQVRIVGWVAISSSRESSQPRDQSHISYVSCIGKQILYQLHHLGSPLKCLKAMTKYKPIKKNHPESYMISGYSMKVIYLQKRKYE